MSRWLLLLLVSSTCFGQNQDSIPMLWKDSLQQTNKNREQLFYHLAYAYVQQDNYDSAIRYFNAAWAAYRNLGNESAMAAMHNNLGVAHHNKGNTDSSLYHYKKARQYYLQQKDTLNIASADVNIGIVYKDKGALTLALEYLLAAARTLEDIPASLNLASCYNTLANIHTKQGNYQTSINYHKKALELRQQLDRPRGIASSLNNIGNMYRSLENYDSAQYYLEKSLEMKMRLGDKSRIASTLNNIGEMVMELNKLDEARDYFFKARDVRPRNSDKQGWVITYNNLGKLSVRQQRPHQANSWLDSAVVLIRKEGLLSNMRDNLETRLEALRQLGELDKALEVAQELLVIKDSLLNKEKAQSLIEMQTKYETEKKGREIALLENNQKLQQAEIELKKTWIFALIVFSVLLAIIGLLAWNQWVKEKTAKKKVEMLMQELHHRVKNNLQLLSSIFSLQVGAIRDESALEAVKSGENRVNAMAIIHQNLYNKSNDRTMDLQQYLTALIEQLAESYGHDVESDNFQIAIEPVELDVDKVIPLGLIVNELVSNAFKYAFTTASHPVLTISLVRTRNAFTLTIQDNGEGFTEEKDHSMGLKIVRTLSRQLKATTSWQTKGQVAFNLTLSLN